MQGEKGTQGLQGTKGDKVSCHVLITAADGILFTSQRESLDQKAVKVI